jgi:hypothetical protein
MASFLRFAWSDRSDESRLWLALAASILLHALLLTGLPSLRDMLSTGSVGDPALGKQGGRNLPIRARIAMAPAPPVAAPPVPQPAPPPAQAPRRAEPAPKAPSKVLTAERERAPALPEPRPDAARAPGIGDFLSDLSSRRNSRERSENRESQPPAAPSASAPLSFGPAAGAGGERRHGGYFLVERMTPYDATLSFYRWNRSVQRLEVARENQISIQLAVIKQVIALMRENGFNGDVNWLSERLGRSVEISAREKDSAKLEAFLMLEFFSADPMRRPQESFAK